MATAAEQLSRVDDEVRNKASSSAKLRILFLIDEIGGSDGGGTERQVLQLIRLAKRLGYEPRLAVLRRTEWLNEESAGCPVYCAGATRLFSAGGWRGCRELVRWMRAEQIILVQTFFLECNILGPWMSRLAGVPVVMGTRRNLDQWNGRTRWMRPAVQRVQRLANFSADCIVANSQVVADTMIAAKRVPARKIRVAHNGIDLAKFAGVELCRASTRQLLGVSDDEVLVGNISVLRPIKGLEQFVEAARLVLKQEPAFRFVVVGGGEQQNHLTDLIRRLGLEDRVRLAGPQPDVLPYLSAMDIGVLSSLGEGFSNSLLEYMACGLPVVATEVGGNREALADTGILVPPNNAGALAEAILQLRLSALRQKLGRAARQRVERFSLERAEQRMEEIYGEMLKSKGIVQRKFEGESRE